MAREACANVPVQVAQDLARRTSRGRKVWLSLATVAVLHATAWSCRSRIRRQYRAFGRRRSLDRHDPPREDCRAGSADRPTHPRQKAMQALSQRALTRVGKGPAMVADQIEGKQGKEHRDGGKEGEPRRYLQALAALTDHAAPTRYRRLHPQAQERQSSLDDDCDGNAKQEEREQRQKDVGQ